MTPATTRHEFARRLTYAIADKGWTQPDLARRATQHLPKGKMIGRDRISKYCAGTNLPQPHHLVAIAKALGAQPEHLLPSTPSRLTLGDEPPASTMSFEARPDGTAHLRIDQVLPLRTAMDIMRLIGALDTKEENAGA